MPITFISVMYPQYTYVAGQQPQPHPHLMDQPVVLQMPMPMLILPPQVVTPPVHHVGTHPVVHRQHYVHMSTIPL